MIIHCEEGGTMESNYLEQQIIDARNNYNYFFVKLIFKTIQVIFWLSIALLISSIFDFLIINIMTIVLTIYAFYKIFSIYRYYSKIIREIKETLNIDELIFEVDFSKIKTNLFKGELKYGE